MIEGFQVSQKQTGAKMAWNDENKNPWGGNNQTPPELEEVIKDFKNKFNTRFGGSGSSGKGGLSKAAQGSLKYFVILAVLRWLLSGIYIVDPAE